MVRARPVPKHRPRPAASGAAAAGAVVAGPVADDADAAGAAAPAGRAAPKARGVSKDVSMYRDIKRLQADHYFLSIPKVAFARLVKDLQSQFCETPLKWSVEALLVFQQAAEEYLMYLYADAYLATRHRKRVTLNTEDLRLVRRLRRPHCWGEPR